MSVIYILIAFSLLVALGFLAAFLWAVRSGQYDDTHTPSMRMLFEEPRKNSQTGQTSPPQGESWRAGKHSKHTGGGASSE